MNEPIILATKIAKRYNQRTIFEEVDLSIGRGQAVAFIGHNGSGKTTLLKILAKLVAPSGGKVWVASGARFAYVPEHFPRMNLTPAQYIQHMGRIEGLDKATIARQSEALFEDFFLSDMKDVPIKHLSKGTVQKVGVVQALLSPCDVLLLDEPLSGQDIQSQQVFVDKILARKKDSLVLLSCHEPKLVAKLADTVYEIRDKALHEVALSGGIVEMYTVLAFTCKQPNPCLPPLPAECEVRKDREIVRIHTPRRFCDAAIISMLQNGYSLKELSHENTL